MEIPEHMQGTVYETIQMENQTACLRSLPSYIYKPRLFRDGNQWCALLGEDIQEGVVGFGESPERAMTAFDTAWYAAIEQNKEAPND